MDSVTEMYSVTECTQCDVNVFEQVPQLSADIQIPEFCYSGEEEEIDINVWIGTITAPSIPYFIIIRTFLFCLLQLSDMEQCPRPKISRKK